MDYQAIIDVVKSVKPLFFDNDLRSQSSMKGDADFVTQVDLKISSYVKSALAELTPEIGFMSEEEDPGEVKPTRWILDPVDGTTNLVFDYRASTISLALVRDEKPVFGIVYNPYSDELFTAQRGLGAFLNGNKIQTSDRELTNCLIEFGAGSTHKDGAHEIFGIAEKVFCDCLDLRRMCSSALAICYIACGRSNGYFEKRLKPWDYAAAALILDEACGYSSEWNGRALQYKSACSFVCGSQTAFEYLKRVVS